MKKIGMRSIGVRKIGGPIFEMPDVHKKCCQHNDYI